MKVCAIESAFGIDHLNLTERPEPELQPGMVLVRMLAAALNFRDLLTVRGLYNPRQPLPLIPCSDGSGEVLAVGPGVTRFAVGDRVATLFFQDWAAGEMNRDRLKTTLGGPLDGTLRERLVLPEHGLIRVPAHLSAEQAATLPCAALTAWSALVTLGQIKAGDTVLVQGTGGVSIFALQFARLHGAAVIATSGSGEKLDRARALGASATINYKETPDWGKRALQLTDGRGVDHVVEVGGAGTLAQSLRAVRPGGTISMIGVLSGTVSQFDLIPMLMGQVRIQGIIVGHRDGFEAMNRAITASRLEPVVDKVFTFEEARAAFEHMASGRHFGKICLRIAR